MKVKITTLFLLLLGVSISLPAQGLFRAGLVLGLNASQINGDNIAGYNKLGLRGGVEGIIVLGEKADVSVGILFSQRGSLQKASPSIPIRNVLHLNFIEVPVLFTYRDWLSETEDYYRVSASLGAAYGRLINYRIENFGQVGDIVTEAANFSDNDVALVAGLSYYTGPHFSFSLYYTRSLTPLYNNRKHMGLTYSLIGYFLSFQTKYVF
ncbi:MAG: PorT family protein [Saprospiraceae bacterium]|nr:PorT family protein [Saprospiraceae bacterium]